MRSSANMTGWRRVLNLVAHYTVVLSSRSKIGWISYQVHTTILDFTHCAVQAMIVGRLWICLACIQLRDNTFRAL